MSKDLSALAYISEQVSYPEDYETPFGYTVHDRGNRFYLTFPAILQSFSIVNRNKRIYESGNIMSCINNDEYIQTMLKQNTWCGELDHPSPEYSKQELNMNRIANPDPKKTSHYIRSPRLNGNLLEANVQTDSSNEHGMNLAIKIVDGKIVPAFSARVLGEMKNVNGQAVINVRKLITYDFVLYPSHREALGKISQPIQESTDINSIEKVTNSKVIPFKELAEMAVQKDDNAKWLCEAFDLTMDDVVGVTGDGTSVVIKENSNIYVQPLSDIKLRNKTRNMLRDWINK